MTLADHLNIELDSCLTEELLDSITEASDPELQKVKDEIEKIRHTQAQVRVKMHKAKEDGKSDSLLDSLKKEWTALNQKIINLWKSYDQKHGTKYHLGYL